MTWSWRLENSNGDTVDAGALGRHEFGSQSDAESWVGEFWPDLLAAGVEQVRLLEDDREVYGPMALGPPE